MLTHRESKHPQQHQYMQTNLYYAKHYDDPAFFCSAYWRRGGRYFLTATASRDREFANAVLYEPPTEAQMGSRSLSQDDDYLTENEADRDNIYGKRRSERIREAQKRKQQEAEAAAAAAAEAARLKVTRKEEDAYFRSMGGYLAPKLWKSQRSHQ